MNPIFRFFSRRTSYCFACVPFVALSGYFAAAYAFFIVYFSIDVFPPGTVPAFTSTMVLMLVLSTVFHGLGFGALEAAGFPAFLSVPRSINRVAGKGVECLADSSLVELLRLLARFPRYHMMIAVCIAVMVIVPSFSMEYFFSRSWAHMVSTASGGLIAGILYSYFCYVITEALTAELRRECRKELSRRSIPGPKVYGISLRRKVVVAVAIVFFSMLMLVYFLAFCRVSLILTAGFLFTTFLTVVLLVTLYFRSVKSAFDATLKAVRVISRGGAELLYLGSNEQELVDFAEHFNSSAAETIALRRGLEIQVADRTRDLASKAEELEEANQRLRKLDRLKSFFLSAVSHELRTPLTSIIGFARLLQRDLDSIPRAALTDDRAAFEKFERVYSNLEIIVREGERLTRLIDEVLDLAKIEAGKVAWNDKPVAMSSCIREALEAAEGVLAEKPNVELKVHIREPLPVLVVDRDRIVQVLVNLLDNAAKVTEEGFVEIAAWSRPEGGVELSVRDTGPGIPREERDLVFERFHQAHGRTGGRRPASGSGLGLAVCREIIKHYGGRISVESEPGRGSCFVVTLPPGCTAPADPTKAFSRRQGVKREEKTYAAEDSDYR
ncbi:MAG: ATP-binding protein [Desulfobacteraceae bacterium]